MKTHPRLHLSPPRPALVLSLTPLAVVLSLTPLAVVAATLAGCTVPPPQAAGRIASKPTCPHVPAPLDAKPPLPPVSAFPQVLQPGHWQWDDGNYVWTPPHWQARFTAKPPVWQDGHWSADGGACVWHNGYFKAATPPA